MYVNKSLLHFSALWDIFQKKQKFSELSRFFQKNVLRFTSLSYSADFRRSRVVCMNNICAPSVRPKADSSELLEKKTSHCKGRSFFLKTPTEIALKVSNICQQTINDNFV